MNRSFIIACLLALGLVIWVGSGQIGATANTPKKAVPQNTAAAEEKPFEVEVKPYPAVNYQKVARFQGEILPWRTVTLRAETKGRVAQLSVEKGDAVALNQPLVKLDLSDRQALLAQAKAEVKLRKSTLAADLKLQQRRLLSSNQINQDRALLAAAQASLEQIQIDIERTLIKAPFAGIVEQKSVEVGDFLRVGDPIIQLVDTSRVKVRFFVPQQQISEVKKGASVDVKLITGKKYRAQVSHLSRLADAQSRNFIVEAEIISQKLPTLLNQSAEVSLVTETLPAQFISPALLNLAANGDLYVKGIDQQNKVVDYPVELLQMKPDGFWVKGMPENALLITRGQGFVSQGQKVKPKSLPAPEENSASKQGAR